jgi:hypothetical protein
MRRVIRTLPGGGKIQIRAEDARDEIMVILARERNGSYPGWAQGSWVLTRRKEDGRPIRIRVFLRSDPNMYVQFRPNPTDRNRSLLDVVIYDAYVTRAVTVPIPFERLITLPVEDILSTVETKFPRLYFDPVPGMYRDLRAFLGLVREKLPALNYRDDGAIDENGRYVYIETLAPQTGKTGLNCSGFAKWIVDGILRPFTGNRLAIPPLREPFADRGFTTLNETHEQSRAPFFGLDWTRNLASTARITLYSSQDMGILEETEVRSSPFSSIIERTKTGNFVRVRSYPDFLPNAGFSFEGLHPLLYTLAVEEPGHIYLASINNDIGTPRMRQHFHVAVLVPYFNEYGTFQIAVFESAAETSFSAFKQRYPGHFINLVRISVDPFFDP